MAEISAEVFTADDVIRVFVNWAAEKLPSAETLENMMTKVLPALGRKRSSRSAYNHGLIGFGAMVSRYEAALESDLFDSINDQEKSALQMRLDGCARYQKVSSPNLSCDPV